MVDWALFPKSFKFGLVIYIIVCYGLGILIWLLTFFTYAYPEIHPNSSYKNASCLVIDQNNIVLDCGKHLIGTMCYHYTTSVDVTVTDNNISWNGTAYKKNNYKFNSYESAQDWLNSYPIGITTRCFYRSNNIIRVVFNKGVSDDIILPMILASIFLLIAIIGGPLLAIVFSWLFYRNKKRFNEIVENNRKSIKSESVDLYYNDNL